MRGKLKFCIVVGNREREVARLKEGENMKDKVRKRIRRHKAVRKRKVLQCGEGQRKGS